MTPVSLYFESYFLRPDVGLTHRSEGWEELFEQMRGHELFGIGRGIPQFITIHSSYLSILAYGGLVEVILSLIGLSFVVNAMHVLKMSLPRYGVVSFAALLCYLVISLTETCLPFETSALSLLVTQVFFCLPWYLSKSLSVSANEVE